MFIIISIVNILNPYFANKNFSSIINVKNISILTEVVYVLSITYRHFFTKAADRSGMNIHGSRYCKYQYSSRQCQFADYWPNFEMTYQFGSWSLDDKHSN